MRNKNIRNAVLSAMFIGIGLVLPFFTGQIKQIGNMLLPMHIPAMLCGFICGPWYGMIVGFILPVMRSVLFTMPAMYPNAAAMSFELASYGFFTGFLYNRLRKKSLLSIYISLISAMISGRIIWGIVWTAMLGIGNYTWEMFAAGAFLNAIPGIILQLILIPALLMALKRANLTDKKSSF